MKRALLLTLLLLATVASPGVAYATGSTALGTLSFEPRTGDDATRSVVTTMSSGAAKGCPADTVYIAATATGPGGWSKGLLVLGTTDQDLSTTTDFTVGLSDSWLGLARSNSTTLTAGRYDVVLSCLDATATVTYGTFTGSVWFSDATHFQDTDPATSATPSQTALSTSPVSVADHGVPVTLTATVTPASATGTIQFTNDPGQGAQPFGAPVAVSGGRATLRRTDLPLGLYTFGAVFRPGNGRTVGSTAETVTFAVRKPPPPANKVGPSVRGTLRPGYRVSCNRGSWVRATSYRYRWLRSGATIPRATGPTYALTRSDARRRIACRVDATNEGGTIARTSPSLAVAAR